jgi:hypothetical protein
VLLLVACDDPPSDREIGVAAYVEGNPVYVDELEHYLDANLVDQDPGEGTSREVIDQVKSRLLDALIEERLLYREAERRGIRVSPLELEAYLDVLSEADDDDEETRHRVEAEARRRLMAQKLQERMILERPELTDEEVATYAADHRDALLPAEPLELRALQLPSMKRARRVYGEIKRKRMTFNEAALTYEPSPGQALPTRMSWDSLPDELRETLRKLKPGQVSEPLELHGEIYLFQVGKWLSDPGDQEEELLRRARRELETVRNRDTLDTLLRELRDRAEIRIKTSNLSFEYVPVEGDSAASYVES